MMKKLFTLSLVNLAVSTSIYAATVDLRILETTDLHGNMVSFDYYQDKPTDKFGLDRTASLIRKARAEATNSILVDNGDLIQGSPMADYIVAKGLKDGAIHPAYKALNSLDYTVAGVGNHEFNYGLDYLKSALAGANFPYINSNILDAKTNQPYFKPYLIVDTQVKDRDGKTHTLKVAYISFVPPQIMGWDKANLDGKVIVKDIVETAKELVPQLRKEGADLIISLTHSGLSGDAYKPMNENAVYHLSEVEGIDAILFGHAHGIFPGKEFAELKGANLEQGTLNNIPAVMPGQWGDHLGVIDLVIDDKSGRWAVTSAKAQAQPIYDTANKKALVEPDAELVRILKTDHDETRAFANQPIGKIKENIYGFLALVQDDNALQIINNAQKDFVTEHIKSSASELKDLPILSAAAPFRAGGRKNDPNGYIEVNAGEVSFRNGAEIYIYPNTLITLKVNGNEVKEWLECSAGAFNQIDVNKTTPQSLINWDFRTYNFDVIDGVNYQIDITQPPRYDEKCKLINPDSHRILNLSFNGKPVTADQQFLIATNNYRAYTGTFPGTGEDHIAFASTEEVRTILANYIRKQTDTHGVTSAQADNNWHLAPITAKQTLDIRVETSPKGNAAEFIKQFSQYPMTFVETDNAGFAVYRMDLQSKPKY